MYNSNSLGQVEASKLRVYHLHNALAKKLSRPAKRFSGENAELDCLIAIEEMVKDVAVIETAIKNANNVDFGVQLIELVKEANNRI